MLVSGFLSLNQYLKVGIEVGTSEFLFYLAKPCVLTIDMSYNTFIGPYAGTVKEPDLELKVNGRPPAPNVPVFCPVWVNETAWSEDEPALDRDITKWLIGTGMEFSLLSKQNMLDHKIQRSQALLFSIPIMAPLLIERYVHS